MKVTEDYGIKMFGGTIGTLTSVVGINANLLNVPAAATHFIKYNTGGVGALTLGETLTGGTSAKTCVLVAQVVENGTAGAGDNGIIFINAKSGTFVAETLAGGTSSGTIAITQDMVSLASINLIVDTASKGSLRSQPKTLQVLAVGFDINYTVDGTLPTVTAGTNNGTTLEAGQATTIRGITEIRNFKCINAVASSGAKIKYELAY